MPQEKQRHVEGLKRHTVNENNALLHCRVCGQICAFCNCNSHQHQNMHFNAFLRLFFRALVSRSSVSALYAVGIRPIALRINALACYSEAEHDINNISITCENQTF
jgi:coproporphyrinogen III oxidase-like Fe-S oxidoreductase